ncbi:MAG: hypothetical protein ABSH08_02740 [Tepidisphaeraceae bacterium]|jgi:hypothetical protein
MADQRKLGVLAAMLLFLVMAGAAFFVIKSYVWSSGSGNVPPAPPPVAPTAATEPAAPAGGGANAADIYLRAAALIRFDCPAASNDMYPLYPPFGNAWEAREQQAWEQNRPARDLARQAAAIDTATWPVSGAPPYLNHLRALANELGDAALYEHEHGHDAAAVDSVRDILHMADLLDANPHLVMVSNLVGEGCTALAMYRLMIITSNIALVADGQQSDALPLASAKELIAALLDRADAETRMAQILKLYPPQDPTRVARLKETFRSIGAERTMAAMSLASHVFYFQQNRWPKSAEELASMLPGGLPKDPWGDGKQTFGYVLIKGGLPDGSDRPLVYCRCESRDEMFFHVDQPEYGYYNDYGSNLPTSQRNNGGQFRDVASWVPAATVPGAPTTRPLPLASTVPAGGQATQPAEDAAKLYLQAAKLVRDNDAANIMSPSASNLEYGEYPPYPAEWQRMEKIDFAANTEARALAHQARSIEHANWPLLKLPDQGYLNECRNLSNELADAALYQHLQGDDAAAIETLLDQWHLADMLADRSNKKLISLLVSIGVREEICGRFEVITSNVVLTKDPGDSKDLQAGVARELIGQLLKQQDAKAEVNETLRAEGEKAKNFSKASMDRLIETENRVNAERGMAGMSLACHLYRFDNGDWPKSLEELGGYLPNVPVDPWGDGKQTLGYALVKGGLPDGSDRPLVYSRCWMRDGLFFRIGQPAYSFYIGDGSHRPRNEQKQGGQFRDIASWVPAATVPGAPATRPLP